MVGENFLEGEPWIDYRENFTDTPEVFVIYENTPGLN
jgi:hypothetical protein